jgi:hypothetical protein
MAIHHMGHPQICGSLPEYEGMDYIDPYRPQESHAHGCPASWYRTDFAASLLRYDRRLTEHGFSPSVALDRCDDPLVLECIRIYERESLQANAHLRRVRDGG